MKIILSIFLIGISIHSFCQQFVATPSGLRNASDTTKKFVMIEAGNLSAKQLYDNALKYITVKYPDPDQAIRNKWDSVDLIFDSYVHYLLIYNNTGAKLEIEAYYSTELRFYNGSVRYEIISLDMKGRGSSCRLLFKGKWLKSYIVYKDNGKLFKPLTKSDIENYFNDELYRIGKFLKQE